MDDNEKKSISVTAFSFVAVFLIIAMIFIFGRQYIAGFNIWCLAMTGEVTIRPAEVSPIPESVKIQQQMVKQANTINKTKAPEAKAQSSSTSAYASRKRPAENGFYATEDNKEAPEATITVNSKDHVVLGPQNWKGEKDLSYRARLYRQEKGFLVVVVVTDDIRWAKVSSAQHQNDCVEIYFDVRPKDKRGKYPYEPGVYHALIVPCFGDKKNADTMVFHSDKDEPMPEGCTVKSAVIEGGYRLEAFFPFTMFKYQPEEEFNFDIGVIDYDDESNLSQMVWSGTEDNYKDALWFGRMKPAPKK